MRQITPEQKLVIERVYAHVVEVGRWPSAKRLRLEFFRSNQFLLENIVGDLNPAVLVCNDYNADTTVCLLHLPALQYVEAAASDRRLVGRIVSWLVASYVAERTQGLLPEMLAGEVDADLPATNRALGFIHYVSGLLRVTTSLGDNILGCAKFDIDDDVLRFSGVSTYEGLLERLDEIRSEHQRKYSGAHAGLGQSSILAANNSLQPIASVDIASLHQGIGQKARSLFADGHHDEGVRCAFADFEAEVQQLTGLTMKSGQQLMAAAFGAEKGRPLLALNDRATQNDISEQEGLKFIAMGAMAFIRNPLSHAGNPQLQKGVALEMLGLASLLFRQLDRTKVQRVLQVTVAE